MKASWHMSRAALLVALIASPLKATAEGEKRAYSLFRPTPDALLRDLSTDRPDKTESPYTVDAGRFQVETDLVAFTYDDTNAVTTRTWDVIPFNFKVGLAHDTDLQVVFGSFSRILTRDEDAGTRATSDGTGDLVFRLKRNVWGNDGGRTALAIMPFVKLPTNTLGELNDAVEGGVIVPLAIDLGRGVGLGLMTEVDILQNEDSGRYSPSFINSGTVGFDLTKQLGLYLEVFTERSTEDGADLVATFDAGLTFALTDNIQLDAGVNLGITDAADDINVFAGQSVRF